MKTISIGLLGCGTVGTGVARLLLNNRDVITARVGANLHLKHVADLDDQTDRGIVFDDGVFVTDAMKVIDDPEIDIIVEMIGGETFAREAIIRAMKNGKHVVTANKALLAKHGNALIQVAREHHVDLAYEASVGGCMPIIKTLRESLVGNRIRAMSGILNGTCNYILSKITDEGGEFAAVLAEAQAKGYAEADPTLDVGGFDTAHKLAIITALAYGMEINYDDIFIEGISRITPMDIAFAEQFGYRIKLLAIGKFIGGAVEARVHPTMIPFDSQLSKVGGTLNAITVTGDAVGEVMLTGHGAGMMPTASAVVGDIADLARNLLTGGSRRIPILSYQPDRIERLPVAPIDALRTHYYIRFSAMDQPGVLSKIAGVLGANQISIKSVHQKGRQVGEGVPIVMMTHHALEADVKNALTEITALDVVTDAPMLIRIEDENGED
ncbi:MAG: homoserine dehydrogenase [Pseudomonadota bacterium]